MNYERKLSVIWLVFSKARNSPDGVSIICVAQLQQLTLIMCTMCQPLLSALLTLPHSEMWGLRLSYLISQSQLVTND